jgi:RND family efflux transporter MFP subunit
MSTNPVAPPENEGASTLVAAPTVASVAPVVPTPVVVIPAPASPPRAALGTGSFLARHGRLLAGVGGGLALIALLLYMAGAIGAGKVKPGTVSPEHGAPVPDSATALVESVEVRDPREFVGTIRPRSVAQVSGKLLARVLTVTVHTGEQVEEGQILARLDDRDVKSRVEQSKLGLTAAEANLAQAESDLKRQTTLAEKKAAAPADLEASEARARALRADAARYREMLKESEVMLGETEVRAPVRGRVLERQVEPGDMAAPGRALFAIEAATGLRIEAWVPEACARTVRVGDKVQARIDATRKELEVVLEEISPSSDPESHSFLVKAALPADVEGRPGEFARLIRACAPRTALLVPAGAVKQVGQLEVVQVVEKGEARARHVRTGKVFADKIEILAGLEAGERVLVRPRAP